jgi:hypothetical protein
VTEDLGQLEEVAARRKEQAGERVPHVVEAELLRPRREKHRFERADEARPIPQYLLADLVSLRAGPQHMLSFFARFISCSTASTAPKIETW